MVTTIQRWGESLAVRIPQAVAERAGLEPGMSVEIDGEDGRIVLRAVNRLAGRKSGRLEAMLDRITPENRHDALEWGPPVGDEVW